MKFRIEILAISAILLSPFACTKNYSVGPFTTTPNSVATPSVTITPTNSGVVTTLAGQTGVTGATNATGTAATFNNPTGVAVDSVGNVYVADRGNQLIRKILPGGVVTTLAGQAGVTGATNATGTSATFDSPFGVAVDTSGNVYVADWGNHLIRKITSGGVVTTLAGQAGVTGATNATGTSATFDYPFGVAVDSSGNVYVADTDNDLIRKIDPAGVVTTLAGSGSQGFANGTGIAAWFYRPFAVTVDFSGNVYVGDTGNFIVREITPAGLVTTMAGQTGVSGATNATGTAASFSSTVGVAVDLSGFVYVADFNNEQIRKISPAGVVTNIAGQTGVAGSTNATGTAALFNGPTGVAVDSFGKVYVADQFNNLIREIQ